MTLTTAALRASVFRLFAVFMLLSSGVIGAWAQAPATQQYVLGPGDVLKITVYQNPDLSLETRVSETGAISYPLLGTVQVGGLSIAAAEKAIADGLRNGNFIKAPQVNIAVAEVKGHQASVLGLVNKPGRYPIEQAGMKLSDLIALAGGVAVGGSETVTLVGQRQGQAYREEIDLPRLFANGPDGKDPTILNGDVVYVDRVPTFYIYGEVQRGGQLRLERGMTVMQALAAGGGVTQRGTQKGMKIHRRNAAGQVQVMDALMHTQLQPGDVIYVKESLF